MTYDTAILLVFLLNAAARDREFRWMLIDLLFKIDLRESMRQIIKVRFK